MHGVMIGIEEPRRLWCHQMSTLFPQLDVRVTNLVPLRSGRFVETVELRGRGADDAVRRMRHMGSLLRVTPVQVAPNHALVQIEVQGCPLVEAMRDSGVVPQMPFAVDGGEDRWLVGAGPDGADRLVAALARSGLERRILRTGDWRTALDDLTELQRDTLEDAVRLGYYEYPRRISLTELARRRGVAKSTISQTLRSVERKIMAGHVTQRDDRGATPSVSRRAPVVQWSG